MSESIKKIVIVGGGTAGWLTAALLSNTFKNQNLAVELVESEEIGTIGVGEATIPPIITQINSLGIDLADFVKNTQASFKLGIDFVDWKSKGESYFHPFGSVGQNIKGFDFFQCWLKCAHEGDKTPLMGHSMESILAKKNKFFIPTNDPKSPLSRAFYALHLDANLAGKYLRNYAENNGVVRTEGLIESVTQHHDGAIKSLVLKSGKEIFGDFFVDCSGFRGLLIDKTLNVGYEDWSDYLPCNRAVTVQTENVGDTIPYTTSHAREAGWTWRIPLQHRTGNGYVFCSQYISDEQAKVTLLNSVSGKLLNEPQIIPFKTGVRKSAWEKNCLSIGLAQGFLEPLESTAIHLVSKTLAFFIQMFPSKDINQTLINEFNRRVYQDYVEIRDFLVLHYCTTDRNDTAFWRDCQTMTIPDSLKYKIEYFKQTGALIPGVEELFRPTSWYAVLDGMGVKPERHNPLLDVWDANRLKAILKQGREGLEYAATSQPSHDEFIEKYCPAPKY